MRQSVMLSKLFASIKKSFAESNARADEHIHRMQETAKNEIAFIAYMRGLDEREHRMAAYVFKLDGFPLLRVMNEQVKKMDEETGAYYAEQYRQGKLKVPH